MDNIKLAEVLKRELKGITLGEIERRLGIPKTLICEWKSGRLPAGRSLGHLRTLAKHLGLTLEQLLFNIVDEKRTVISSTTFTDAETKSEFRIYIEKVKK